METKDVLIFLGVVLGALALVFSFVAFAAADPSNLAIYHSNIVDWADATADFFGGGVGGPISSVNITDWATAMDWAFIQNKPTVVNGTDGINGTNGVDGAQGPQGPQGPQGETGAAGTNGADGIDGTINTVNMVSNPSAEVANTGYAASGWWCNAGASVTRSTDYGYYGGASIKVVTTNSISAQGLVYTLPAGRIESGGNYTVSFQIRPLQNATYQLMFGDNAGNLITSYTTATLVSGTWTRITVSAQSSFNMAAGTVTLTIRDTSASVQTYYVDGLMLEPRSSASNYCDGDRYGCVWLGTANAAQSIRVVS